MNADVLFQMRSFMHQRPERFDVHFKEAMTSWYKFFETGATLFASIDSLDVSGGHPLPTPPAQAHGALPPLPAKPTTDLLSTDDATSKAPAAEPAPAVEAAAPAPAPAEPEPSTPMSRVEKFGVRMLPIIPVRPAESQPAAAPEADSTSSGGDAPPPLPPKPKTPEN